MPPITEEQEVVINLFRQIIDLCYLFLTYISSLFTSIVTLLTQSLSVLASRILDIVPSIFHGPVFTLIFNWLKNNPNSVLGQLSLLQLMVGGGFIVFLAITIIKWIIGIFT